MSHSTPAVQRQRAARFALGTLAATPGALQALLRLGVSPLSLLRRHVTGDFGDLDDEDQQANEQAIASGFRVFSAYKLTTASGDTERLWVITEADRSVSTILLPREY